MNTKKKINKGFMYIWGKLADFIIYKLDHTNDIEYAVYNDVFQKMNDLLEELNKI